MAQLQAQAVKQNNINPVLFSDPEITMFINASCDGMLSIGIDVFQLNSPLWVNLAMLTNFAKLYLHYWSRAVHCNTPLAIEQRLQIFTILSKIKYVFNVAIHHECIINNWVDLRQLLKATFTNKKENLYLAKYPHNKYDILEIEQIGLKQSKIELEHDIQDEMQIKDVIMFSKLMAFQLHGIQIL
jgi:hypothetical protein